MLKCVLCVQVWALATDAAQQRLIVGSAGRDLLVYSLAAAKRPAAADTATEPPAKKSKKRKGAAQVLLQEEAALAGLQVSPVRHEVISV